MDINLNLLNGKQLPKRIWRTLWWVSIASIALVRMYLVSHDEIAPTSEDSLNYATQANYYLAYGPFAGIPSQTPGLSIFAFATTQIGIPYKVSLDLLLILVALICCQLVSRLTSSRLCGLFAFGLIALNPWFMTKSKMFMTEPLIAVLMVALIACSYQYLFLPVRKWRLGGAIVAGLVSATFNLTRSEFPLLLLFWFLVVVAALFINWKSLRQKTSSHRRYRILLILVPLATTIVTLQLVKAIHHRYYGVAAIAATEASGFKDLINALYSIPPDENIRFAPVTMQSLALACDASPTLNKYRTRLLTTNSDSFESARQFLGLEDEIGTWLNWHLIGSFGGINWRTNAEMKKAAGEIRQAQRDGRLKKRIGIFPIDPLWSEWLPDIPGELYGALALSINPGLYDLTKEEGFSNTVRDVVDLGIFDSGLLRRKGTDGNTVVRVFAQSEQTGFRRVRIKSSDGLTISDSRIYEFGGQFEFGFILPDSVLGVDGKPKTIEFYRHQNEYVEPIEVPITANVRSKWIELKIPDQPAEYFRISATTKSGHLPQKESMKMSIAGSFNWVYLTLLACAFMIGAVQGIKPQRRRKIFWFAAIGIVFLLARSMFYTLVQVWLHWSHFRYVEPNSLFLILVFICLAFAAGAWLNSRIGFLQHNRFSRCRPRPVQDASASPTNV